MTARPWLWLADIAPAMRPPWVSTYGRLLSASEAARLQRIERPQRRAQFLAGHVLLRRLVATRASVAVEEVEIGSAADGRPEVLAPAGWRASLAHSHAWVAALIDAGSDPAGVDVEWMSPHRDIEAIVRAACACAPESRAHAYRLWAEREAVLKAGPEGRPPGDRVYVATWNEHALAVCAGGPPQVRVIDLAHLQAPEEPAIEWTIRPAVRATEGGDGP